MRVVFAGTPEAALPSLRALLASDHEVLSVLTRPDAPTGRGRVLRPSPVREVATAAGVPVLTPARATDPALREQLAELAPEACPVVAYGALLRPPLLEIPVHGWINLHFSLLPAWRGAAPVQHAVLAGEEVTGASTFVIEEGLDTGPVLGTLTETIRATDTSGDLLGRLAAAGADLLVATLDALETGTAHPVPQGTDGISHAPKLLVEDARVRWDRPAYAVDRQVRAATPAPGPWTTWRDERLKLGRVDLASGETAEGPGAAGLVPGEVRASKRAVLVGTGSGAIRLREVQPQGKSMTDAAAWARGVRPAAGERLGEGLRD